MPSRSNSLAKPHKRRSTPPYVRFDVNLTAAIAAHIIKRAKATGRTRAGYLRSLALADYNDSLHSQRYEPQEEKE